MTETSEANLKERIAGTIAQIKEGNLTPKNSGIGRMFHELMSINKEEYLQLLDEYKPIAAEYFKKYPNKSSVNKEKLIQREMERILAGLDNNGDEGDFGDDEDRPRSKRGPTDAKPKSVNRDRIAKVKILTPKVVRPKGARDRSNFKFNGIEYGKGPLVHAILTAHVEANKGIKHDQMKLAFPDALLRSYGIFKKLEEAQEISKDRKRYFLKESQIIKLADCSIAVCNQFTSDNIQAFLGAARKLGYSIEQ
jgi:hypothetical protein